MLTRIHAVSERRRTAPYINARIAAQRRTSSGSSGRPRSASRLANESRPIAVTAAAPIRRGRLGPAGAAGLGWMCIVMLLLASEIDLVRELVAVAFALMWEVLGERLADRLDALQQTAGEVALLESCRDHRGDRGPEGFSHLGVDALVAEHHEGAARRHDEDEHSVARLGVAHAEAVEGLVRGALDAPPEERRQRDADLRRGAALA